MMRSLIGSGEDPSADIRPRAVIQRFFLAPHEVCVGVLVEMWGKLWAEPEYSVTNAAQPIDRSNGIGRALTNSYGNGEICSNLEIATSRIPLASLSFKSV
jgi:hypothetical protein